MRRRLLPAAVVALALAACSGEGAGTPQGEGASAPPTASAASSPPATGIGEQATRSTAQSTPAQSTPPAEQGPPRPEVTAVVARDLRVPWGIDFLPDGSALVAERDRATIRRVSPSGRVRLIGSVSGVVPTAEGGLLGLAVSPTYAQDHLVYVYFTTDSDNRVARMTYRNGSLGPQQPVLTGIPAAAIHNGGRLEFGPDGKLYVSTGESGDEQLAQDPGSLGGKILRINPDGTVPAGNPGTDSPVWTLGHRNVEGLAFDDSGRLWATEFGPDAGDEVNRILRGHNYGWPAVIGRSSQERFTAPRVQWSPAKASPSGLAYAEGSLWAAALRGERLWRVPVRPDGRTGRPRSFLVGEYGRLRSVVVAPDGALWVSTSNYDGRGDPAPPDDRILRVALR